MIKIILNGYMGKMGKAIRDTIQNYNNTEIVAGVDKSETIIDNTPVYKNINDCKEKADVILDFSRPAALDEISDYALHSNIPIVLCTTGYSDSQIEFIKNMSEKIAVFRSANMSLGVNIVKNILKNVTPVLYHNFDIEIIEKHHNQKVDSPSGTALLLADEIKSQIPYDVKYVFGREGNSKRDKKEIGIHSVRGGSIVGDHDIIFAGLGETIEINHHAISREVFANGALMACEYIAKKEPGLYSMDNLISEMF